MKILAFILLLSMPLMAQTSTLTVVPATSYQTMRGWEAAHQAGESWLLPDETEEYPSTSFANYDDNLFAAMLDVGINRIRLEVFLSDVNATGYAEQPNTYAAIQPSTASAGQWHYDRVRRQMDAVVVPYRDLLTAQGETLFINLCIVDFDNAGYDAENTPSEYAFFVNKIVTDFEDRYGFLPDTIEAILEPDAGENSTNWTAAKIADNIVAADSTLTGNGFTGIKWIAPSTTDGTIAAGWYQDMVAAQAGLPALMAELSYHSYTTPNDSQRDTIASEADGDGIGTAMLEYIGADFSMLWSDLTRAKVTGWQQYTNTFPYTGWTDDGAQYFETNTTTWAVTPAKRTKWLRHIFKYVRRGAVRKGVTTTSAPAVAFQNSNDTWVVVIRNSSSGTMTVEDLPAGTYGINYSYGSDTNDAPSTYNQSFSNQTITTGQDVVFTMTGAGVATVYNVNYMTGDSPSTSSVMRGGVKLSGGVKLQ